MSKLVRGDRLPSDLKREVLASYIYRWTSDNASRERAWRGIKGAPTIPLVSDEQWLREHAFHVTDRGTLDKRQKNAEPAYMTEDKSTIRTSHATKKSRHAALERDIAEALAKEFRVGDKVYAISGGRRHGPGIIEEIYDDGSMRVDFTKQLAGRLRVRPQDVIHV